MNIVELQHRARDLACQIEVLEDSRDHYMLKERRERAKPLRRELAEVNAEIGRLNEEKQVAARVTQRQDYALDHALKVLQQREAVRLLGRAAEEALEDPAAVGVDNLRALLAEAEEEARFSSWKDLRANAASRVERLTAAIRQLEGAGSRRVAA